MAADYRAGPKVRDVFPDCAVGHGGGVMLTEQSCIVTLDQQEWCLATAHTVVDTLATDVEELALEVPRPCTYPLARKDSHRDNASRRESPNPRF